MAEQEQPSERVLKIEQYRSETGEKYRRLCDAQQLLNRRYGREGWHGDYIGPTEEEREVSQREVDELTPQIFDDTVTLFKGVGGQQAWDTYTQMVETIGAGRFSEEGWNFTPPFYQDRGFLENVLIQSTEK